MSIDKTFAFGLDCDFEFIVECVLFNAFVLAGCMHASEGWVRSRIAFAKLWMVLTLWRVFKGIIMGKDDEIALDEVEEDARDHLEQPITSSAMPAATAYLDGARSRWGVFGFAGVNACLRACVIVRSPRAECLSVFLARCSCGSVFATRQVCAGCVWRVLGV